MTLDQIKQEIETDLLKSGQVSYNLETEINKDGLPVYHLTLGDAYGIFTVLDGKFHGYVLDLLVIAAMDDLGYSDKYQDKGGVYASYSSPRLFLNTMIWFNTLNLTL